MYRYRKPSWSYHGAKMPGDLLLFRGNQHFELQSMFIYDKDCLEEIKLGIDYLTLILLGDLNGRVRIFFSSSMTRTMVYVRFHELSTTRIVRPEVHTQ